jgi:hypothetical protein
MDNLFTLGLQIVLWFQSLGPWLSPVMKFFFFFGFYGVLLIGGTSHSVVHRFSTWDTLGIVPDDQCLSECCLKSGFS